MRGSLNYRLNQSVVFRTQASISASEDTPSVAETTETESVAESIEIKSVAESVEVKSVVDDAIEVKSITESVVDNVSDVAETVPKADDTPTEPLILEAALVQEAMDTKEPVIILSVYLYCFCSMCLVLVLSLCMFMVKLLRKNLFQNQNSFFKKATFYSLHDVYSKVSAW